MARASASEGASRVRLVRAGEIDDWSSLLTESNPQAVFWLASSRVLADFLAAAERAKIYPLLLAPSVLAGPQIYHAPKGFEKRIFLSFPILPDDQSAQAARNSIASPKPAIFRMVIWPRESPRLQPPSCLLKARQAGREVTREKIVALCEQTYELNLGQMLPVSFGPLPG
jgi:hypothetical protein